MDITGKILDGKYKIIKLVGTGGMARVYKAQDIRLDRYVAVKVLKEDYAGDEQFVKKFMKEAQAAAKLAHPNIVNVYDVGSEKDLHYIVMELMGGPSLNDYLDEKGVLSAQETVDLIYSIALGLNHAHANNIIHRDIKPHNILMTPSHMPKVADFGIAVAAKSSSGAEDDGLGSVHYVSPEQAKGGVVDERSDLYSLGIMMFEMLTGELPYDGDSPVEVALMHVQNTVPSPRTVNKRIPEGVAQVVLNLTRKDPKDRYQNARALLDALRKLKSDINCDIEPTYKLDPKEQAARQKNKKNTANIRKGTSKGTSKSTLSKAERKKRAIIAGVVFGVLVITALVFLLMPPKMVEAPQFVGHTVEEAQKIAEDSGLKVTVTKYVNSTTVKEGLICEQSVVPGTEVEVRTEIEVYVSTGPKVVEVPSVIGYYEDEARTILKKENFVIKETVYEFNDKYEKDMVFSQNPAQGTMAAEGTEITLYVSKGKDTVSMPKILGMTLEEARTVLAQNGLILRSIEYDTSSTYSKDLIMKQSPTAYSTVDKNTTVDIVISIGKETYQTIQVSLKKYTGSIQDESVSVRIEMQDRDGNYEVVYAEEAVQKNETINVEVKGTGERYYMVYVNGLNVDMGRVNFQ
ncbi:MAG: Stk1 family PASTA domain-containing Ser/Thr kinase [Eubacteriaceae bacterium]|nr:Stk1 family PASTA domain-containing Ser/Thr kinase [Eubacteriaceae bacterium]